MSYSEFLSRYQQRLPKVVDTRPKRTAAHQTEVFRQVAASSVYETLNPANACVTTLNAPSTASPSTRTFAKAHVVKDASDFATFSAAQDVARLNRDVKPPRINDVCYSSDVIREVSDTLRLDANLRAVQQARLSYQNCCVVCGRPSTYARLCRCRGEKPSTVT